MYDILNDMPERQISAHISMETKARLDRYVRNSGVTRGHVVEQALQHYLQALDELPPDLIVSTRLVLSERSAVRIQQLLRHPGEPTEAMRRLFDDR